MNSAGLVVEVRVPVDTLKVELMTKNNSVRQQHMIVQCVGRIAVANAKNDEW
jgi:hypothetical protein